MKHDSGVNPSFVEKLRFEELFRLVNFGRWVEFKQEEDPVLTLEDLITKELDVYISRRMKPRLQFVEPHFLPMILQFPTNNRELEAKSETVVTDHGICETVNGNSVRETFKENERITKFNQMLDRRDKPVIPSKIKGSGSIHKSSFWLNVRDPLNSHIRGEMVIALNDWLDFFSVRYFEHVISLL